MRYVLSRNSFQDTFFEILKDIRILNRCRSPDYIVYHWIFSCGDVYNDNANTLEMPANISNAVTPETTECGNSWRLCSFYKNIYLPDFIYCELQMLTIYTVAITVKRTRRNC